MLPDTRSAGRPVSSVARDGRIGCGSEIGDLLLGALLPPKVSHSLRQAREYDIPLAKRVFDSPSDIP
jgi:hypothetical protein